MVRSRRRRRRRDVHARHRDRASRTSSSSPRATAWAKRWCRARSIRTSSTSTSRRWRRQVRRSSAASLGSKLIKMEFATPRRRPGGSWCKTVDVPHEQRNRYLAHRRRRDRAREVRGHHREALRPSDGHRVGQGRPRRQALHPAGASGNGEEPGGSGKAEQRFKLQGPGDRAGRRAARSARRSAPVRCA